MSNQQKLRSASTYVQSDQSLFVVDQAMTLRLPPEQKLESHRNSRLYRLLEQPWREFHIVGNLTSRIDVSPVLIGESFKD